ncbi:MAG: response regulator transcription factor [Bacteroidia bacterium]|jgi:DNA-binding NarL/FixJ family response regulator|nr:response regulator transcription factor [Bacteroidia bacterium]
MSSFIIADDHPITLVGMESYVKKLGHKVLGTYDNGISAYNGIQLHKPEYAILDLGMPGLNGIEVLGKIRSHNKTIKIIIYTMYSETALFEKAVEMGVNGYILKDFAMDELKECLETLVFQNHWFSPRLQENLVHTNLDNSNAQIEKLSPAEIKIAQLISQEQSTKQIAEKLFISIKTVENHRRNISHKLQLGANKNALLIWAVENKHNLGL